MKGLILSGGAGTRLRPITYTSAKQLIPIANKPILFRVIEDLRDAGVGDIGIVVGDTKKDIMKAVGNGSSFGVKVTYIEQEAPRGIAHAVYIARDFIKNYPFVVYLGDNVLKSGIRKFVEDFRRSDSDAAILLSRVKDSQRFGVAEIKDGKVIKLIEKPEKPKSDLALVGIYFFRSKIFKAIEKIKPSWRNELEITDAIQGLIDSGGKISIHIVKGWWKDTGRPEDILEANRLTLDDLKSFNKGRIEDGVTIRGKVAIDEGTIIRKGSTIRGPVIIGKNCEIGPDAYIGPYTSIGNNTIIKWGKIEASIIIGDSRIECRKKIVDSLIGRASHIASVDKNLPKGYKLVIGENSYMRM